MHIKDIRTYEIDMSWKDDPKHIVRRTVAIDCPSFYNNVKWTEDEERFDYDIFFYYEDYSDLNQQLKDGKNTNEDFIVHQIYNT